MSTSSKQIADLPKRRAFNDRLADTGLDLAASFGAVVDALPGAPVRPQELAKRLRLNKDASSRLLRAIRQADPVAVAHLMPGPEPLRRMLRVMEKLDIDGALIERARQAVRRFETLIESEAGDRGALDAMITTSLPEAREKHELIAKQTAFRGMSLVKGMSADLSINTVILTPSPRRELFLDFTATMGVIALRRFHNHARMHLGSWAIDQESPLRRRLDGEPAETANDLRLDAFSSPGVSFESHASSNGVIYTLTPPDLGRGAAVDVVLAELQQDAMMNVRPPQARGEGHGFVSAEVTTPTKAIVLDVLLEEGVFPRSEPALHVYDIVLRGVADVNDPLRHLDRHHMAEQVRDCGRGIGAMRLSEAPRYVELLEYLCTERALDPSRLRAFRARVEYPVYGSQVCLVFPRDPA